MKQALVLLTIICFSLTSCCSTIHGKHQTVLITSEPSESHLIVDGYDCGTTPLQVELTRNQNHTLYIEKESYEPRVLNLSSRHTFRYAENLAWPFVGAAVGTGIGLAICGTGGYIIPYYVTSSLIGLAAGTGLLFVGTATDVVTGAGKRVAPHNLHLQLQPVAPPIK